jgi:hypothetical protein
MLDGVKLKEEFIELTKDIVRPGFDKLLNYLEKTDFYTSPSSTKYHNNTTHGNLDHSINVYKLFSEKCQYYKNIDTFIPDEESIKIMALFHDISKVNIYYQTSKSVLDGTIVDNYGNTKKNWVQKTVWDIDDKLGLGHEDGSVSLLQSFIKLKHWEIGAIKYHHGIPMNDYGLKMSYNTIVKLYPVPVILLHNADNESANILEKIYD